jgi:hypothetical protein
LSFSVPSRRFSRYPNRIAACCDSWARSNQRIRLQTGATFKSASNNGVEVLQVVIAFGASPAATYTVVKNDGSFLISCDV